MKRLVTLLLVSILLLCLAVPAFAEEEVTLIWSGWSGEEESTRPAIMEMIDSWNALDNGITVQWVGWPWDETVQQLLIRSQGGEPSDLAQVDMGMYVTLREAGVLKDLNTLVDSDWLEDNFESSTLALGKEGDQQLNLPWTVACTPMLYNPSILEAAGVEKVPETIEEFEEALEKIYAYDSTIIPYALCTQDTTCADDFQPWIWTFGGQIFGEDGKAAINSEFGVKTLEWYKKLLDKGFIRMNMTRFDARVLFAQGKVAFYDDIIGARATAIANGMDAENIDNLIKPMARPVVSVGDPPTADTWSHMLVVFEGSEHPKEAMQFIQYILEQQSLMYFETNGMLPVIKSVAQNEAIQNDSWSAKYLELTATAKATEVSAFVNNDEMSTIIAEEVQAALTGVKDVQTALDDAAARLDKAAAR